MQRHTILHLFLHTGEVQDSIMILSILQDQRFLIVFLLLLLSTLDRLDQIQQNIRYYSLSFLFTTIIEKYFWLGCFFPLRSFKCLISRIFSLVDTSCAIAI